MNEGNGDLEGFDRRARHLAKRLLSSKDVLVVGHIDADGISAASIAYKALIRAGVPVECRFAKRIDEVEAERINNEKADTVWLVDLGSGYSSRLLHPGICISDHHAPDMPLDSKMADGVNKKGKGRNHGASANLVQSTLMQDLRSLNPMEFGFDGSRQISGAGATYWVAKSMNEGNADLSALALVGAVGDFQDSDEHRLVGLNRSILDDAVSAEVVEVKEDIVLYGRETRQLTKFLQYSDLPLPWTRDWTSCKDFFKGLNVPYRSGERLRTWTDLTKMERDRICARLTSDLEKAGKGDFQLIGESYIMIRERPGSELHDAKEYATLLNSCGRHGAEELGLRLCVTSRDDPSFAGTLGQVRERLQNHRNNLKGGLEQLQTGMLVDMDHVRYYRTKEGFGLPKDLETTLGSVIGMVLGSGSIPSDRPLLAFAFSEEGGLKVSSRATKELVDRGLDLSSVMREAASSVGGAGGGHSIAAGATIPIGQESIFLEAVDRLVGSQLNKDI